MSHLSEPEQKRVNLNIDAKLHRDFKIATVMQGKRMSDVLLDFIRQYVHQHYPEAEQQSKKNGGRG